MSTTTTAAMTERDWMQLVKPYQSADTKLAVGQLLNTVPPLLLTWTAMYLLAVHVHWALALLLAPLAAGFVIRIFIFQHDCGHGSFLPSRRWNEILGRLCSVITFTPFDAWRRDHAIHHASAGNLDHRGVGDIKTLTLEEYRTLSPWGQLRYRLYRHPLVLFGLGPTFLFVVLHRLPYRDYFKSRRELSSVMLTNLSIAVLLGLVYLAFGPLALLAVWLPTEICSSTIGVWLFYVQHQFDEAYWEHDPDWTYTAAALEGSSYLKLPKWLQWFTGNIGLHHLHHLSPRIPNYKLQQCHDENPIFHTAPVMSFWQSLKTIPLALWDEKRRTLISFTRARRLGLLAA